MSDYSSEPCNQYRSSLPAFKTLRAKSDASQLQGVVITFRFVGVVSKEVIVVVLASVSRCVTASFHQEDFNTVLQDFKVSKRQRPATALLVVESEMVTGLCYHLR